MRFGADFLAVFEAPERTALVQARGFHSQRCRCAGFRFRRFRIGLTLFATADEAPRWSPIPPHLEWWSNTAYVMVRSHWLQGSQFFDKRAR